ncbi:type II toxin-antitoxin system mRNA interferase toxin, RelE/StbE family [Candidatus Microgenomates bacterium]|nr:type II toxin-antitoxin system mRNA interferase toxin, RelE/StbE family [Candidatus Microgenomates bacterium]
MIKLQLSGDFDEMYRELVIENPDLKEIVWRKIKLLINNPQDTRLYNHALRGKMEGQWAFSINSDIRIVYEWLGKNTVRFLAIGGHKIVYN